MPHGAAIARFFAIAIREKFSDVGAAFERQVVQTNEHAVFSNLQIWLDKVRALLDQIA